MPIVSIIIPVYNRPQLVSETIESVLVQTNPGWELIVVDDGSTDTTWDVLQEYAKKDERIRVYKRDREPKGANRCRNMGIEKANGKYIIFLDSDDLLAPDCLENRINVIENSTFDFVVFNSNFIADRIDNNIGLVNKHFENNEDYLYNFISCNYPWQTTNPIWKTETMHCLGGFDENLLRLQDPELHIRAIIKTAFNFTCVNNKVDSYIRKHSDKGYKPEILVKSYPLFIKSIAEICNENKQLLNQNRLYDSFKDGLLTIGFRLLLFAHKYNPLIIKRFVKISRNNKLLSKTNYLKLKIYLYLYIVGVARIKGLRGGIQKMFLGRVV